MHIALVIFFTTLIVSSYAQAEHHVDEQTTESSLWLEYHRSSTDSNQYALELNLAVTRHDMINLRSMHSEVPQTNGNVIEGDQYSVEWETRRFNPFFLMFGYDYYEQSNGLRVDSAKFTALMEGESWAGGINTEYHWLNFDRTVLNTQLHFENEVLLYGPEISYYGEHWSWKLFGYKYQYQNDPAILINLQLANRTVNRTVLLPGAINDWLAGTELYYQFSKVRIGVTATHTVTAVNQTSTDSYSLILNTKLSKRVELELEGGVSQPEVGDQSEFGVVRLGFHF